MELYGLGFALIPAYEMSTSPQDDVAEEHTLRGPAISYRDLMFNHGYTDRKISGYPYSGSGTEVEPYIVGWLNNDPRKPLLFTDRTKWLWTLLVALATMAVALTTSAYTAPAKEIQDEFQTNQLVFELGLSVFVLGFAVGPVFWGPLSELFGRQIIFVGTVSEN